MPARLMATIFIGLLLPLIAPRAASAQEAFGFATWRGLPGVTSEEAEAVERLIESRSAFVFGGRHSTELFLTLDGEPNGFGALFCDWLTGFFGIPFRPRIFDQSDLLLGLAAQEIDFTADLAATPERRERFAMTPPLFERTVRSFRLDVSEPAPFGHRRYGMLAGADIIGPVRASLDPKVEIVEAYDYAMAYRLLQSGAIDAFVDESPYAAAFDDIGDVAAEYMLPMVFVPVALSTANPDLAPIVSVVSKAMDQGALGHLADLQRRGHQEYLRHRFLSTLTPAERAYVHVHSRYGLEEPIPVGMEYDNYPVAFYNEREKAWQGCAVDILEEIGEISGLNFVHAFDGPTLWPEMLRMLESGEMALISELIRTPEREGRYLWTDQPFMTDSYALVSRSDYPNVELSDVRHLKVGLSEDTAYTELFRRWFPGHPQTREYFDVLEPLFALERGEVDLVMSTQNQLLSMTNYLEKPYFRINIPFNAKYDSYFGLNKSETLLRSVIGKAMLLVNSDAIAERWKRRVFDYKSAVARERMPYLIAGMALFLCVIVLLAAMFWKSRRTSRQLEAAVEERTRALRHQTSVAEQASRAKSLFLARTSHEIRTPMNAIIGLSELALREYGQPMAPEYIAGIKNAGASLLAIINDLLDFSKIESGNLPINPAPYAAASLLCDTLTIIRLRMSETPLKLFTEISPDVPATMIGDAGRVRQILLNLLGNSVKYTQKGFVKFSVTGQALGPEAIRLTFTVEDSGIGIRPADMPKLFGEFTRLDERRNTNIEGTGLGLIIARSLCRAMGGDISVESEYGRGSVFTATVVQAVSDWAPLGDISGAAAARVEARPISFTAPEAEVLVVDDFPSNLLVAEGLLRPYLMRVHTCPNGREAVELVRERPFDLVLMDHMMPEMDGVEATRAIRGLAGQRFQKLPIIALTANAVSGMREMFLENGFNGFLSKPIDTAKLDAALKKWTPESKRRGAPPGGGEGGGPEEGGPDDWPEIEGVDSAAGLARIGGSKKRYRDLLAMFCRDAAGGAELLGKTPDDSSRSAFTTLVHAMKSALANIGADDLSRRAAALEKAGREADWELIHGQLPLFRDDLNLLTSRIGEAAARFGGGRAAAGTAPGEAPGGATAEAPGEPFLEALAGLRAALEARDVEAVDGALERLRALPLTGRTAGALSTLEDLVLTMEFEKAGNLAASLLIGHQDDSSLKDNI